MTRPLENLSATVGHTYEKFYYPLTNNLSKEDSSSSGDVLEMSTTALTPALALTKSACFPLEMAFSPQVYGLESSISSYVTIEKVYIPYCWSVDYSTFFIYFRIFK